MDSLGKERIHILNKLAEYFTVDCYTNDFMESRNGIRVHPGVGYYTEMPVIFRKSKINLYRGGESRFRFCAGCGFQSFLRAVEYDFFRGKHGAKLYIWIPEEAKFSASFWFSLVASATKSRSYILSEMGISAYFPRK